MSDNPITHITPSVLLWARESAGYTLEKTVEELKRKTIDKQKIEEWENGIKKPNYSQLEQLAELYKRPVAVFFFPSPPPEETVAEKFSALPQSYIEKLSTKIRFLVRKAMVRQLDLEELEGEEVKETIKRLRKSSFNPQELASQMRKVMGISVEQQWGWKSGNCEKALKKWRQKIEDLGVWVFKDDFREDGCCGFYLPHQRYPVIYLNNSMPKSRQIFTLFHELGHFLLAEGGVDFRGDIENELAGQYRQNEIFCNAFADAFLAPDSSLEINEDNISDEAIQDQADKYKVSREVILRKCLKKGLIDGTAYSQKVAKHEYEENREINKKRERNKGGGNYYYSQKTCLGNKYLELAFSQFYKNRISEYQLANYLGVRQKAIPQLEGLMLKGEN